MLQSLLVGLGVIYYMVMACCFCNWWLEFFLQDVGMTSSQRRVALVILIMAAVLWPFVVPFAYMELLRLQKRNLEIIDVMVDDTPTLPKNRLTNPGCGQSEFLDC